MPPVKGFRIPDWANPDNASVLDSPLQKAARTIGQFLGINDPQSQIMGLAAAPIDVPAAGAPTQTLRAYHGSPHDFDRFDASKIGTGEGAQAYGHGLYFAENPQVAADYRSSLARPTEDNPQWRLNGEPVAAGTDHYALASILEQSPKKSGESVPDFLSRRVSELEDHAKFADKVYGEDTGNMYRNQADRLRRVDPSQLTYHTPGRTYEVNIHASPDELLDWDKPLSQQPQKVQEAIAKVAPNIERQAFTTKPLPDGRVQIVSPRGDSMGYFRPDEVEEALKNFRAGYMQRGLGQRELTGGDLIERSKQLKLTNISQDLRDAGIKGIQYLDQGSRAAGEGTRNFVIFPGNEHLIDIARKYGVSLAAAKAIYDARQRTTPQPAQ